MFKRSTAAIGLVMLLALVAAACGGATISASGGDGSAGARAAAKINPKARLVYGTPLDGSGFSQRLQPAAMTAICDAVVGNQVFSPVIKLDVKTQRLVPNLAASWKVVDPSTFSFKLRPNLTFQDGTKLDAAAAKAALDITRAPTSKLNPTLSVVTGVDAGADGLTVTLHLATPTASAMPYTLAGREGYLAAAASTDTHPIGAGPFGFDSQTVGQKISLTKFAKYWNAKSVKLGGIDYVTTAANAGVNSVIAGDIDSTDGGTDVNAPAEHDPNVKIETATGASYWKININTSKPNLNNAQFRQAMNYAIDRATIAKTLFGPSAEVAAEPYPTTFKLQYQKNMANKYPYNPKKAIATLKAAGITTPVSITGAYPAGIATFQRFAEIVQQELKAVGINLTLAPSPNLLDTYFQKQQGDIEFTLWPPRPDPSVTISRQFAPDGSANAGKNNDPNIVAGLAKITGSVDPTVQGQGYKQAVDAIVTQALEVPIVYPVNTEVHRTYVTSKNWQVYGPCQGVDFSQLAITTAKK
ncbi:MAG: peptide transporter [Actinomycetia bacterium]|nr:peptide transporter [Actinomycetes bacterium]